MSTKPKKNVTAVAPLAAFDANSGRDLAEEITGVKWPHEDELTTQSDVVLDSNGKAVEAGKWKNIGDCVEGFFLGMEYQETKGGRPFAIASIRNRAGQVEKIFLPTSARNFFFANNFPVNEFISLTFIAERPIPGLNNMKCFQFKYSKDLVLDQGGNALLSPKEMKEFYNPVKVKRPKGTQLPSVIGMMYGEAESE